MKMNPDFQIIKRTDQMMLANIENGDLYQINDVVVSVLELCEKCDTPEELATMVYNQYANDSDSFTQSDMVAFLQQLIDDNILTIE